MLSFLDVCSNCHGAPCDTAVPSESGSGQEGRSSKMSIVFIIRSDLWNPCMYGLIKLKGGYGLKSQQLIVRSNEV